MKLLASFLILMFCATCAEASYVTDALAQMPVKNTSEESVLSAKIISGGAPAIKELCGMLVPLGTEGKDDTNARDAITSLVRYVGRPGGEADRVLLSKGLCDGLSGDADWEVKSFFVCRLQDMGHDEAVPALAPLLGDEKLGLYASAALERIGTPVATEALVKALPAATGKLRVGYIKALGELRAKAAAGEIRKAALDTDKDIRMAALWALANMGDESANDLLTKDIKESKSAYEQSRLYDWAILNAKRQSEAGAKEPASAICLGFLNAPPADDTPANVQIAAARLLVEIQGEGALGTLLPMVERGDRVFRAGVLDAIARTPGEKITTALVGRLKATENADVKVEYLNALAKRNDAAARPAVIEAMKDADAAVRSAAVGTLVALGRDEAIAPLVEMVIAGGTDAKAAAETLSRMPGDKALAGAAGALDAANAKGKTALLELLAARGATAQKDAVLKQTADADDAVRLAAFKAMEKIGGEADAPKLIELAIAAKNDADATAALKAAAACAAHIADTDHRSDAFVAALGNAKGARRTAIEKAVAKVGGAKALVIVVEDLKNEDKATREGALDALADWQGADAVAPLLDVAKTGDADQQATAIRGIVRVIQGSPNMPVAEKAAAYGKALAAAKRPEEKRMVLGAIASEHGQEMFDLAASTLDEEALKAEASIAVIKTSIPQPKGKAGLKGAKVMDGLAKAIPNCPDGGLKADAERYLKTLKSRK
jgi:HEAT repeat protein